MPIDLTEAKENYVASAPTAGARYKKKVLRNTTQHEHSISDEAEALYAAATAAAAAAKRRQRAAAMVSQEEWKTQASTRGATNIVTGITAKAEKQSRNFAPYAPVIDNAVASLPARGMGYLANRARIDAIALALEQKKKELKG